MKKLLALAACALAAVLTVTGCGKKVYHAAESQASGVVFAVGFDADFPPYGFKAPDGSYIGFDLDLAREVCKRNQWRFEARPIAWEAKDMELNSGSIDCIWNGFTINGREKQYEWTLPYVDNSQVVLVLKDSKIKNFNDLAGKIVAAQTDTPVLKALSGKGEKEALGKTFKKLVVTPNYNNAIMELESGSVDAVAMDIGVAKDKMKSGKFRMLDEIVISEKYGVGFKLGNKALRDIVQKTLIEMAKDGTAAKISAKYFEGKNVMIILEEDLSATVKASMKKTKAKIKADSEKVSDAAAELKSAVVDSFTATTESLKPEAKPEAKSEAPAKK